MIKLLLSTLVFASCVFSEEKVVLTREKLLRDTNSILRYIKLVESHMNECRLNSRNFTNYMKTYEEMEKDRKESMVSVEDNEWFREYMMVSVPLFEWPHDTFRDYLKVVKNVYELFIAQLNKNTEDSQTPNSKYWRRVYNLTLREPAWNIY